MNKQILMIIIEIQAQYRALPLRKKMFHLFISRIIFYNYGDLKIVEDGLISIELLPYMIYIFVGYQF